MYDNKMSEINRLNTPITYIQITRWATVGNKVNKFSKNITRERVMYSTDVVYKQLQTTKGERPKGH